MVRIILTSAILLVHLGCIQLRFPGENYHGVLPAVTDEQTSLAMHLREHVVTLSEKIGERNIPDHPVQLAASSKYIQDTLKRFGYTPKTQPYYVDGQPVENISAEIVGSTKPDEIVVVGAHYDSVHRSPGANDNGTGTAAVLEIARVLSDFKPSRTIRFVFFVNEEPPYFRTEKMGSLVYARECANRKENIVAMMSIETIGCYSDVKGSQRYPGAFGMFYPNTGNFISVVGDSTSRSLTSEVIQSFRKHAKFPSEGAVVPRTIDGAGWSDHWSFWQAGYKGVMVTDTAPFRYAHYHAKTDTPDKIDFDRTGRVVSGLMGVVKDLGTGEMK